MAALAHRLAPAKTASRANPALRRHAPARRPVSYGSVWENRRRHDRAASSGSFVGGNPLNAVDPSGLICISGVGCYTTPAESRAANSGDYKSYYNMACAGGDSYACFAGNVANNQGILGHAATAKVISALVKKEMQTKSCIDEDRVLEEIRKALARDYANYLPQSRSAARYPSASAVADFHQDVFESLGLPPTTFGGTPFDPNVLVLPQVWCPNCRP